MAIVLVYKCSYRLMQYLVFEEIEVIWI